MALKAQASKIFWQNGNQKTFTISDNTAISSRIRARSPRNTIMQFKNRNPNRWSTSGLDPDRLPARYRVILYEKYGTHFHIQFIPDSDANETRPMLRRHGFEFPNPSTRWQVFVYPCKMDKKASRTTTRHLR